MHRIDIALIKPVSQKLVYGELSSFELTAIEPPLWGAILAGYLRKLGYSVVLYDEEVQGWSHEETAKEVQNVKPHLAVVVVSGTNPSASTMNMSGAGEITTLLKQLDPEIKTMLAGLHPSALPERTAKEESADFVCQGEGFYTIPKLIDALKNSCNNFEIEGLCYEHDGNIILNPRPAMVQDLCEIGQPAWDMLPMQKYRAHNWHCFDNIDKRDSYAVIYTSLGCPFKCSFCCINALFGKNRIRYRSTDDVVREIDFLVNSYGTRNIKIIDEMFAMNERRVVELCDKIIERKYNLNMWAYARVNTVTEPMLVKMKQAGINWLAYGFESGSKRVIEDVTKGYKMEQVRDVVKMSYDLGFHICANYIFGLPEDDYDSMNETLALMFDINAEYANIYSAMAYPGSQLYEMAVENNWQLPDSWHGYSQYGYESQPLPTKYLSGGQVLAFRDYAFEAYHKSPRYLAMMRKKFGDKTVAHVNKMTSRTLERKFACI